MAKLKAARSKPKPAPLKGAIPCLILIVSGMLLLTLLFYAMLKSSA